jgi:hypothetical protein
MASLITSGEAVALTDIFGDIFDTFSRNIVVHKEPLRTIAVSNQTYSYGYSETSNEANYTYSPVTGVFPATIKYGSEAALGDKVRIKVKEDAKLFIREGRTEKITVDDKDYNVISYEQPKRFLTSEFFVFYLEIAK